MIFIKRENLMRFLAGAVLAVCLIFLLGGTEALAQQKGAVGTPAPADTSPSYGERAGKILGGVVAGDPLLVASGVTGADLNPLNIASSFTAGILASLSTAIGVGAFIVQNIATTIAGAIFALGGYLLQMGLNLNSSVVNSYLVQTGWLIARDFANLGFVLAIIFIAFATVLRIQSYGLKTLFGRLVIMALLINFSLVIAGTLIDFTTIPSNFFLEKIKGKGIADLSQSLASAMHTSVLLITPGGTSDAALQLGTELSNNYQRAAGSMAGALDVGGNLMNNILRIFFVTIFTIFSAVVMMASAVMIFMRYVYLVALLVLAPLAWISYIFPPLSKYWSEWWNKLLEWTLFLPAVLFFFYLAVLASSRSDFAAALRTIQPKGEFSAALGDVFGAVGQMAITLMLMVMGLMAGKKIGAAGADWGLALAQSTKNRVIGAVRGIPGAAVGAPAFAGGYALSRYLTKKDPTTGTTRGEKIAAAIAGSRALSAIPGLRGIARNVAGGIDKLSRKGPEAVKNIQKQYSDMSNETLLAVAKTGSFDVMNNDLHSAAVVNELVSRKMLVKLGDDELKALSAQGKAYGVEKDIHKIRPDFSDKPWEILPKLSTAEVAQLSEKVFISGDVVKQTKTAASLDPSDIEAIGKSRAVKLKDAVKKAVDDGINAMLVAPGGTYTPSEEVSLTRLEKLIKGNPLWV